MKILIDFVDTASQSEIDQYLTEENCTLIKKFESFGHVYLVEHGTGILTENLTLVSEVKTTIENEISLLSVSDTLDIRSFTVDNDNWWKAVSYWDASYSQGDTVDVPVNPAVFNVYVMDSGIDKSHPEFSGQTITELYSVTGEFSDQRGHGTALASLISGNTCALSRANLFDVKIVKPGATTSQLEILEALDTIHSHFLAQSPQMPAVVNMSWSIPHDPYINFKIYQMTLNNIMIVAAAGNSGIPLSDVTPACNAEVYTIGAYNENFEPANFSNYTSSISNTQSATNTGILDYWAPGTDIRVANLSSSYSMASGTSVAAAIVTGCIVYNMSARYEIYNDLISQYWNADLTPNSSTIPGFIKHRSNILDLPTDYDQSTNKIVTFNVNGNPNLAEYWHDIFKGVDQTFNRGFYGNTPQATILYDPHDVSTIEQISGTFPEGFDLTHGFIVGEYTGSYSVTNPPVADFESEWRFTSHDGTVTTITYNLQFVDPEYVMPSDPSDPEYDVVLLALCENTIGPPCNSGTCPIVQVCEGQPKPNGCGCVFQ